MDEMALTCKAAWRRENATHHYAGRLSGSRDGLQLAGRDPATGIEVTLLIPAEEIEEVGVSQNWEERVVGEPCVILELANSIPILVRELGCGPLDPDGLASQIRAVLQPVHAPA